MKKITKELPNLNKTINIIGDLMADEKGNDLPLEVITKLIEFKQDVQDFYTSVNDLQEELIEANAYTDEYIDKVISGLINDNKPTLELIINSGGGSVTEGFAIVDLIKELQELYEVEVNTHAIGSCASMAVAVYMAGDIRTAGDNVLFMLHQISGGARGSQNKIQSTINCMNIMSKQYKRMFADANIPAEQLDDILSHDVDYYFDIDQAREWGIVNDDILMEQVIKDLSKLIEEDADNDTANSTKEPDRDDQSIKEATDISI